MGFVEFCANDVETIPFQLLEIDVDRNLESLAVIANVQLVAYRLIFLSNALLVQPGFRRVSQLGQILSYFGRARQLESPDQRPGELVPKVRNQIAQRAEQAGSFRHNDRPGSEQVPDGVRVQRSGSAEGDKCEVPRIVPTLYRDQPQRAEHMLVGDVHDA